MMMGMSMTEWMMLVLCLLMAGVIIAIIHVIFEALPLSMQDACISFMKRRVLYAFLCMQAMAFICRSGFEQVCGSEINRGNGRHASNNRSHSPC